LGIFNLSVHFVEFGMKHTFIRIGMVALATYCLAAPGSIFAASVGSTVFTIESDVVPPVVQTTSSVPGQTISRSGSASDRYAGTATGSSTAQTDFGVNRVGAKAQLVWDLNLPDTGLAYVDAYARSTWQDSLVLSGGRTGDSISVTFNGVIDFELTGGVAVPGRPNVLIDFGFSAASSRNVAQISLESRDFFGDGPITWTRTFAAQSGDIITINSSFTANLNASFFGAGPGIGQKSASFDAMNSSVLGLITVDNGYSLDSTSGMLMNTGNGFIYQAAAVPEPTTYAMILGGLCLIGVVVSRLRGQQCSRA